VIALIVSTLSLVILIDRNANAMIVFLYSLVIFCIKVIPIYLLINTHIKPLYNIISFIILLFVYQTYMVINGMDIYDFYAKEADNILNGNSPIVHKMLEILKNPESD